MLVSALIPTRNKPQGAQKAISSLLSQAFAPSMVEFVLKVDDDQEGMYEHLRSLAENVQIVTSERGNGYLDMCRFVNKAAQRARGQWSFLIDDDAWIDGSQWDLQLAAIPPGNTIAQCECYTLGASAYGRDSCGPTGLFVPTKTAQKIPVDSKEAADVMLYNMTVGQGWIKHLLTGVRLYHDGRPRP